MRVLSITKVEQPNGMTLVHGVVENAKIVVGDDAELVDAAGAREPVTLSAIMPDYEGPKEFDEGSPGKRVKVVLRRRKPSVVDATKAVALEKA